MNEIYEAIMQCDFEGWTPTSLEFGIRMGWPLRASLTLAREGDPEADRLRLETSFSRSILTNKNVAANFIPFVKDEFQALFQRAIKSRQAQSPRADSRP